MAWKQLILIFFGGGLGASLRFALANWINECTSQTNTIQFPWGIFACNLIGCLLIGIFYGWLKSHHPEWIHPLFVTGLFGGFTTFSAFALDTQMLVQKQAYLHALLYSLGSLIFGLLLCFAGYLFTYKIQTP